MPIGLGASLGIGGGRSSTSSGAPSGSTPFVNEWSISLDGTDDYVDCGGASTFSFTNGSGNDEPFSISAWVKLDGANRARVVAKGDTEFLFGTDGDNKFSLLLWSGGGLSAYLGQRHTSVLSTGTWYHLAATYDGSNAASGVKLYIGGSAVALQDVSVGSYAGITSSSDSLLIGEWSYNNSNMDGLVDEVAIFDSELSSSDITAIYNSGVPAGLTSLSPVGWWRMGDGTEAGWGTTIYDMRPSGTPNNGTLTNGPTYSTDVP